MGALPGGGALDEGQRAGRSWWLLDEAFQLLDVAGLNPPVVYEWLYFAHQVLGIAIRGKCKPDSFTTLRDYWSHDGLIAIIGASAELVRADQEVDPAWAVEIYDRVVETVRPLWHEWFQARLRLTATVIGIHGSAAAQQSVAEREASAEVVRRMLSDGERVIDFYAEYETARGPEYQAWVARLAAEDLRWRWLSQLDPPSADELVSVWLATEEAFVAYGSVYEIARVRARCAEVLRATGDATSTGAIGSLAREAARALRQAAAGRAHRAGVGRPARAVTGRLRDPDPARDRDPGARRRGPHQRGDRQAALHQHQDGVGPCLQHPRQARGLLPHRGGGDRAHRRGMLPA